MPDGHAKSIKVLVRQLAENLNIDVVLGEASRILGHAELFEPICNLLHRGPPADLALSVLDRQEKELYHTYYLL